MRSTRSRGECSNEEEIEKARQEKRDGKRKVVAPTERNKKGETKKERGVETNPAEEVENVEEVITKPYGNEGRFKILQKMKFIAMRFPHRETMEELGIYKDVKAIFKYMELNEFMKLSPPAYHYPTMHFLSTLKVVHHPEHAKEAIKRDGAGFIAFSLGQQPVRMSIKEIEKAYGFHLNRGLGKKMEIATEELKGLWETISSSKYEISHNKGSQIRNPAIRYAHKALANTMFARFDCASVTRRELEMLDIALMDYLVTLKDGTEMKGDNSCEASMAMVMLDSFKQCMKSAILSYEQGRIGSSHIRIGSLITPILRATSFPLPPPSHEPLWMDITYLNKNWVLKGMAQGKHVYRFHHPRFRSSKVLLPNTALTTIKERGNILFELSADDLYMDGGDATINENDEGEPSNAQVTGARRYDFEPFDASRSGQAVKKAHEHIRLLQRLCKWQGKTIKKLVRTVKDLKVRISGSTSPRADQNRGSHNEQEADSEATVSRRSSQRKRRAVRSPTPESSNPSLDEEALSSLPP